MEQQLQQDQQQSAASSADFLAPNIDEVASQRGGQHNDPRNQPGSGDAHAQSTSTDTQSGPPPTTLARAVARRLLPACVVVPAVLWWALVLGHRQGWYDLETSLVLFVFSVAAVFGLIVCLDLRRLARMDGQRAEDAVQLRRAKEAAENANRFRSAFFANISHEIRTPLTAINGFAELMLAPSRTEDERLGDARIIRRNGEHLLNLINDILDLSKIEAGKMTVDRIYCNVAALVGEVCSMLRHRAHQKGLALAVRFEGDFPASIRTDPTRFRQILINLVSNAIKFTKHGGVTIVVAVVPGPYAPDAKLQVQIEDSGIGIPRERLLTLFEPFVQGDASITRQYGGSGLGLAIARHFARALGGDIVVDSTLGKGSTFTMTVETDSLLGIPLLEHPEQATDSNQPGFNAHNVRIKGSILVAEDGADNQALIAARLRGTGLKVEIAPNGRVALEKALASHREKQPFDLILMDVQMPEMDGYTATLQLRSEGYRGPIIALTANASERDRDKCLNAGCNDFVTKPIQLEKLFKAMGRYLKVEHVHTSSLFASASSAAPASGAANVPEANNPVDPNVPAEDPAERFYSDLLERIDAIDRAIEEQDRERLRELIQLVLGKAAAAGLREAAAETAKLLQMAEVEPSWVVLKQAVREFPRDKQVAPAH